jgi:hypothetical protein
MGLLLVPISAVAAFALVAGESTEPAPEMTAVETTTTTEALVVETVAIPTTVDPAADLAAACGDDGWTLVAAEADGTITELEQAALDALRPICAEASMELAGPPAPPPVIRTVTVSSGGGGGDDASDASGSDDDESREHDDDDHDDDHDEEDEEDAEDEEDDHDEEDEDEEDDD